MDWWEVFVAGKLIILMADRSFPTFFACQGMMVHGGFPSPIKSTPKKILVLLTYSDLNAR